MIFRGRNQKENKKKPETGSPRKWVIVTVCAGLQVILAELIWAEVHRQPVPMWCVFAGVVLLLLAAAGVWDGKPIPVPAETLPQKPLSVISPETICLVMQEKRIGTGLAKRRMTPAGERLFQLRKRKKLTLQQASEKWGISLGALDRYELGHELLKSDKAVRIARIEGVSLDWLFAMDTPEGGAENG